MKRKSIAFLLVTALILALLPTAAFAAADTVIDTVAIEALNPPQAGQPFSTTTTVGGKGYYIANVTWEPWDADETFAPNTEYSLHVRLEAEDGYQFSDNLTATVNGIKAECQGSPWEMSVFASGYKTSEVAVNFAAFRVKDPNAGAAPATNVEIAQLISSGAPVSEDGMQIVRVEWSPAVAKFADLTAYTVTIYGKMQPGYALRSDFFCSVNDMDAFDVKTRWDLELTNVDWDFRLNFTFPATGVGTGTEGPTGGFSDVPSSAWYYNDVMTAVELGLIAGKGGGLYKPDDNMTVAEAIKLAACMNQLATVGKISLTNGTPWYSTYVNYAVEAGIIERNAFTDYNTLITREVFVDVFAKALPEDSYEAINTVEDNAIPDIRIIDPYGPPVYKLYRAGILTGDANGDFWPADPIKRSEVAAILTRMMDPSARKEVTLVLPPGAKEDPTQFTESEIIQLWERIEGYWNQVGDRKFVHFTFIDDVPSYTNGIWEAGGTPYGTAIDVKQPEINKHVITIYVPDQPETEMNAATKAYTFEFILDTRQSAEGSLQIGNDADGYTTYTFAGGAQDAAYQKFVKDYY